MTIRRSGERLVLLAAIFAIAGAGRAWSQDPAPAPAPDTAPAPAQEAGAKPDDGAKPAGDITARYRLQERYTGPTNKPPRGSIAQFQVAFRETITWDDGSEPRVVQAIYSERPVDVSPVDERVVTDSVRHFSKVSITPDPWKGRKDALPLVDLTVWYQSRSDDLPLMIVLTPGRSLREEEYRFAISYDFVTNLSFLLPDTPVRIGDSWKVTRPGTTALINDDVLGGFLSAKLAEIRNHPTEKGAQIALITVAGKVVTGQGRDAYDSAVNAQVEFVFTPVKEDEGRIDATGSIDKVRLGEVSTLRAPNGVKAKTTKRDLIVQRKRPGTDAPLTIPSPAPKPTVANSWLTYADREGRFTLQHPQSYVPAIPSGLPNTVDFKHERPGVPPDIIRITYVEKPEGRPEATFDLLVQDWQKRGFDVQKGLSEKLPASEWPDMSVHHMEAALTGSSAPGRSERRFFDAFVMQFAKNVSLFVSATTFQDRPETFRAEVRSVLKSAKLGGPKAASGDGK